MTIREIANAVNKDERTVHRWAKKASDKMSQVRDKMSQAYETKTPANYTLDETCFIIGIGLGKNAAALFRENAKQNEQVAVQNEPLKNEVSEYVTKNDLIDFAKTIVQETISGFLPLLNGATKQIEFKQDYFSVKGYSSKQGQQLNFSEAITLGKIASKLSRERGVEIRTIEDERFGFVNSYHVDILDEVFRM